MNVYIDSNFLLEIGLNQEQFAAASTIRNWAVLGRIQLICPTLCLAEPLANLSYRRVQRKSLRDDLRNQSNQLARNGMHHPEVIKIQSVQEFLERLDDEEAKNMRSLILSLLRHCRILTIEEEFRSHAALVQDDFDLELQDALIAASVLIDLRRQGDPGTLKDSLFVSRDFRAFSKIKDRLKPYKCSYITKFVDVQAKIESLLSLNPPKHQN